MPARKGICGSQLVAGSAEPSGISHSALTADGLADHSQLPACGTRSWLHPVDLPLTTHGFLIVPPGPVPGCAPKPAVRRHVSHVNVPHACTLGSMTEGRTGKGET